MDNLIRTALLLLVTLVIFPLIVLQYDPSMTTLQWELFRESGLLMLGFAALSFVVSELSKNYSQTDKLWGLTPIVYTWHMAWRGGFDDRMLLMAALVTLWGIRLSYNFNRRGGFSWKFWTGEEDYRWAVLRALPVFNGKPFRWSLFNLLFISFYQHALIWLFCLPALVVFGHVGNGLGLVDWLAAAAFLSLLVLETIADQQQFDFQAEKYRRRQAKEPLDGDYLRGFRTTGLWGLARHPNYACEQGMWLVFYLFSVAATGQLVNWSLMGALLLVLLFKGSSDFSEAISLKKYPSYAEYQQSVARFVPGSHLLWKWLPKRS